MLYDEEQKKYCRYRNGDGKGDVSARSMIIGHKLVVFAKFLFCAFSGEPLRNTMIIH